MYKTFHRFLFSFLLVMVGSTLDTRAETPMVDPAATTILKQMTDYLGGFKQFSVTTQTTLEDLSISGHRVDLDISAKVVVSRPNKIRAERKGDLVDQIFYYNGRTLTLFNPLHNVFSSVEAPDTFYGLFQYLHDSLGFGLPISDLVLSYSYPLLMQDVTLAQVVGAPYLDGVACYHLLFSRPGVDFQIWVSKGSTPLPLKYVVTDTATDSRLSISTRMSEWQSDPLVDDTLFTFVQPEGAQSIEFVLF